MKTAVAPDGTYITVPTGRVITFGLDKKQNNFIEDSFPTKGYELLDTDNPTDLIAVPATALVINAAVLNEDGRSMFFEYYTEIGAYMEETVFSLGSPKPPHPFRARFKCYEYFEQFACQLKYHLLTAHSKLKKAKIFSKKLADSLMILSIIRSRPGIRTQELAEQLELSTRSVQRYIESLRVAGEWIEYDTKAKGWRLMNGVSVFFGDYQNNNQEQE